MNYSLAILLANPACRAIMGIYKPDSEGELRSPDNKPVAKRELFKTFDKSNNVGDIVCVPSNTRHKVTTVKVVEVDVNWDIHYSGEARWIIGKIDQADYDALKKQEGEAIEQIKEAEKTHEREELKKKMFAHMDPDRIKTLAISNMGTSSATIGAGDKGGNG